MPVLNYTTEINANKTVGEIQQILAKAGAKAITIDYDGFGNPVSVSFSIILENRWLNFRLPSSHDGIYWALKRDNKVPRKYKSEEHAIKVAWRVTKDWVEAQIAIIQAQQAELAEVFLPYVLSPNGETLFQLAKTGKLLLGDGN